MNNKAENEIIMLTQKVKELEIIVAIHRDKIQKLERRLKK